MAISVNFDPRSEAIHLMEIGVCEEDRLTDDRIQSIFKSLYIDHCMLKKIVPKTIQSLNPEEIARIRRRAQINSNRSARQQSLSKQFYANINISEELCGKLARSIIYYEEKGADDRYVFSSETKLPFDLYFKDGKCLVIQSRARGQPIVYVVSGESVQDCYVKSLPLGTDAQLEYGVHSHLSGKNGILTLYAGQPDSHCIHLFLERGHGTVIEFVTNETALGFAIQCAEALETVHQSGFVHRDVKGRNFLLIGNEVKLADFGSAHPDSTPSATIAYLSPEYQNSDLIISDKTDVWAFGCLMIELFLGCDLERDYSVLPWVSRRGESPTVVDSTSSSSSDSCESPREEFQNFFKNSPHEWRLPDLGNAQLNRLLASIFQVDPSQRPIMSEIVAELKSVSQ